MYFYISVLHSTLPFFLPSHEVSLLFLFVVYVLFIVLFAYFIVLLEVPRILQKDLSFYYGDPLAKILFTYHQKRASGLITL